MPVPRVSEMEVRDPKEQGQAHQWDPAWGGHASGTQPGCSARHRAAEGA